MDELNINKKTKNLKEIWGLGSIVALKSHPFGNPDDPSLTIISGEAELTSPLLVVTELLYSVNKGNTKPTELELSQCKCLWYSQKTDTFQEVWINRNLLKLIRSNDKEATFDAKNCEPGTSLSFLTSPAELGKRKSNLKQTGDRSESTVSGHLTFVCPPLTFIMHIPEEAPKNLTKEEKTGVIKKVRSAGLVKCKYYNPTSGKMSEAIVPLESVFPIPQPTKVLLDSIRDAVANKKFAIFSIEKDKDHHIGIFERMDYRNGIYFVDVFSFIENKTLNIEIVKLKLLGLKNNLFSDEYPKFKPSGSRLIVTPIDEALIKKIIAKTEGKGYLRIQYKDINDNLTWRTIQNYSSVTADEKNTSGKPMKVQYLKAHCLLRKDVRYFKIERIQKLQILDLKVK